jgi:hypothetical protein
MMHVYLRLCLSGAFLLFNLIQLSAQERESDYLDTRSDSIDILHYTIDLNLLQDNQNKISAATTIRFKALLNGIDHIVLDLKGLTVDSIYVNGEPAGFTRQGEKIRTAFSVPMMQNDEDTITVWYGGSPFVNIQDFGRFYITNGFSYNIGVSFLEDPHNFGRAWFPCFDNFVERSTYTCRITTRPNLLGYSGGILTADTSLPDRRIRTWEIRQQIPTYLMSAASAAFQEVRDTFQSLAQDTIPVLIAAVASDTTGVKNGFVNLEPIFHLFEEHFGPYLWDRVGYVMVPFTAGAMEHAMNIAFPRALLPAGAEGCNHIMAHELAHSWFGNLVTCRTASEMWLNEGFCKYTEFLFDEWLKNRDLYDQEVRLNHRELLLYNHLRNGGYHPLSNIPTAYTYSASTYALPADILHNLRTYTGDSLFYAGLRHYLSNNAFSHATSATLRESMKSVGAPFMDDFFRDWVDNPGWPHFAIDSLKGLSSNQWKLYFRQKSTGNTHTYTNVPFTVSFRDASGNLEERSVRLSGPLDSALVQLPFQPVMAYLNRDEKIGFAVTGEERLISSTGNVNWPEALVDIDTRTVNESAFLRVEHHFAAPDPVKAQGSVYTISPNRYWKVYGTMPEGFFAKARFVYNGRKPNPLGSIGTGWLDTDFTYNERKLVLLYRKDSADDWKPARTAQNTLASLTDMFGNFVVDTLYPGEYVFAESDTVVASIGEFLSGKISPALGIQPNPAGDFVRITYSLEPDDQAVLLELSDQQGKLIQALKPASGNTETTLNLQHVAEGIYQVRLLSRQGQVLHSRLIISR